ncbi:carbamoyl-phosphate synthase large subunit [Spirochaeta africana]|uniref:Carbamoyl phosphate synthase large chain n=1 Tax=Spirochaeta africana (strain ATCC 700263 / DSM 8902 / Z-7692) TaxID=889378 RepID=H9UKA6_SPIAZ|nr:carbamoyl-phosphate synthase large subunit [Spirochaeta africana]AFG37949.1 carbamoyl-phosphate synthase, large subunit [Spirochaeta africana DSM 8902]
MPARRDISSILIFGSGPIVIGQACEFDYSGNQAVRALKEEGYRVILVNPNPATIMTTPGTADAIYMDPLEVPYVEDIIRKERPDAVLPTMGGQTALNLTLDLAEAGIFEKYGVELLGAGIDAIQIAEDRGKFKELMTSIGLENPNSTLVTSLEEARAFLDKVGVPIIIRPSYTLGGRGGSIAYSEDQFDEFIEWALAESPVHQVLLDESLLGWKEFELEVMRDQADNAVVVCSIENVDPMGVHTGDSITVAPIQTLSDREYQHMRTAAIRILQAVGVECGGSNVQFAVNPEDGRMVIIEMNPRVSRSSALASKATGFPIARCAARLAVGFTLDEIVNDITGKTVSCFEPSLDYVAVKVPRFELEKFPAGYAELGTQMKSVGETLAIGRTFPEALNKAIRAGEFGFDGLEQMDLPEEEILRMTRTLHPRRIFAAYSRIVAGGRAVLDQLQQDTGYDPWFLHAFAELAELEKRIAGEELTRSLLLEAKRSGLTDQRIAVLRNETVSEITALRERHDIHAVYHFVDTCSGEFAADTPYFYSTYGELDEGGSSEQPAVMILASGPNRIGQGLEFDTCCTLSSMAYRRQGVKTIIVNSNPETVSTDFNVSDRLYLEPLTPEDVLSIVRKEKVRDVVVQLGGQTPLNMAEDLQQAGVSIVGTSVESIQGVEDRGLFSSLINRLGLEQPVNRMAGTVEDVYHSAEEIGYPVLLRPSFVLGGRSMVIAYTRQELEKFLAQGVVIREDQPVLVDQFLEDAFEYDIDAISDGANVYIGGIMQHIEAAGVHSGDSACVFPPYKSNPEVLERMKIATAEIARDLGVRGFLNIQFAVQNDVLYVLEVNPRASRTVPFLSKASGVDMVDAAVKLWLGQDLVAQGLVPADAPHLVAVGECVVGWAVKEAMFSFDRFRDQDPLLGPEMKSTGEVIGIGADFGEAFAKATQATGTRLPVSGRVFVSVHEDDKDGILDIVRGFQEIGFEICATRGTADFLFQHGVFSEVILKVHEGHPNIIDHMRSGRVDLLINTPKGRFTQMDDSALRIESVRRKVPYTTTTSAARAALEGIRHLQKGEVVARPLPSTQAL